MGQDEEKLSYMTDNKKQVQEDKEKVQGTAQTPKDRTTETKNQAGSNPSKKTGAANGKVSAVAQSAKESALAAKDKTATILEKTSVQVKGMTASATDAVKRTLGMGTKVDPNKDTTKEDIN